MPRKPGVYLYRDWFVTSFGGVKNRKLCRADHGKAEAERLLGLLVAGEQRPPAVTTLARVFVQGFGPLSPDERVAVFEQLLKTYCPYCGEDAGSCQCLRKDI